MEMKKGYWKWLSNQLGEAWKVIKIIPLAFWDLLKWIAQDLRKLTFSLIKNELKKMFSWENICASTGGIFCLGLIFVPLLYPSVNSFQFLLLILFEVTLFLVSTYAYWRDKPND